MNDPITDKTLHLLRAESNSEFLNSFNLEHTQRIDWALVVTFYTALHYIDAFLSINGHVEIKGGHSKRNDLVDEKLNPIAELYMQLYWGGRNARYEVNYMPSLLYVKTCKDSILPQIKGYIIPRLK